MDYEPIETWLIGNCGMSESEAGWVTLREFLARYKAAERKAQEEWERARWQMFLTMQMHPNIKPHKKAKSPTDWIRFPWEKEEEELTVEKAEVTTEQIDKLNALRDAFMNKQ